jgi:hypothetical protein
MFFLFPVPISLYILFPSLSFVLLFFLQSSLFMYHSDLTILLLSFIFSVKNRNYDAYDDDIAIMDVFFDNPTVFQFGTQSSQTWYIGIYFKFIPFSILEIFQTANFTLIIFNWHLDIT